MHTGEGRIAFNKWTVLAQPARQKRIEFNSKRIHTFKKHKHSRSKLIQFANARSVSLVKSRLLSTFIHHAITYSKWSGQATLYTQFLVVNCCAISEVVAVHTFHSLLWPNHVWVGKGMVWSVFAHYYPCYTSQAEESTSCMFVNCDHQRLAAKQLSSSGTRPLDRQVDATSLMLSRADALLHELLRDHLKYRHAVANSDFKENLF